jgi:hypothetical protein
VERGCLILEQIQYFTKEAKIVELAGLYNEMQGQTYHTDMYESKASHQNDGCTQDPGEHQLCKAIEIQLHPRNFNREAGFILSQTWQMIIDILKHSAQQLIDSIVQVR